MKLFPVFTLFVALTGCAATNPDDASTSESESHLETPAPEPSSFGDQSWKAAVTFGAAGTDTGVCANAPPSGLVCWFAGGATHPPGKLVLATLHMTGDTPEVRLYYTNDNGATMTGGAPLAIVEHATSPSDLRARLTRDENGALTEVSISAIMPFGVYFTRTP